MTAPSLSNPIADKFAVKSMPFFFSVPTNTFTDADIGDVLSYSAMLSNGSALPSWLKFDATTRVFSGTPAAGNVGLIAVRITVNDGTSSVSDTFNLSVAATNEGPKLASLIDNKTAKDGVAFDFTIPAGTFTDADGIATLTYSATLAGDAPLPAWLKFDAGTRRFTGTPGPGDVASLQVKIVASDGLEEASDIFDITVSLGNQAPTLTNPIVDRLASVNGTLLSFTLPANTFTDVDGAATLTWSATLDGGGALPAWLKFDAITHSFTGTQPTGPEAGMTYNVKVTVSDGSFSVSDIFDLRVVLNNVAPLVAAANMDQSVNEDSPFTFIVPAATFTDADTTILFYSATLGTSGSALPDWLKFDIVTRTFSGTPTNDDVGKITVTVAATDGSLTAFDSFDLTINNVSDAPTGKDKTITIVEDKVHAFAAADFGFADVDKGINANSLASVIIKTLPTNGVLKLNGDAVTVDQVILLASLNDLQFMPDLNEFGNNYAELKFSLKDDGKTDNGGTNVGLTINTLTFNVTSDFETFTGTAGRNRFTGTSEHDVFIGHGGNDVMTGKGGSDTFMFSKGDDRDLIKDFDAKGEDHDILNIATLDSIVSFKDLKKNHADQVGNNVVIDGLNGDRITLVNVKIANLDAGDFVF